MIRILLLTLFPLAAWANVNVLCVGAHPDDETLFAATVYAITHELRGNVDVLMVTNGETGNADVKFAERLYGEALQDRAIVGKTRQEEAIRGGEILGIRNYTFLEQPDNGKTLSPFDHSWNKALVMKHLNEKLPRYDFVFVHLPTEAAHGHRKAATLWTLEAIAALPKTSRPIVLGAMISDRKQLPITDFPQLEGHPITAVSEGLPLWSFPRSDYHVIINWFIAEHKSQGSMQAFMNFGDRENFYYFDINAAESKEKVSQLFDALRPKKG